MKKTPGRTEVRSSCAWTLPCSRASPSRCRGLKRSVTERRFVRMVVPVVCIFEGGMDGYARRNLGAHHTQGTYNGF